jgi:hypothetical protein
MSDFEQALQATLQGVTEGFRQASADLHQEVNLASESVTRLTNGVARLGLRPEEETPSQTSYLLVLELPQAGALKISGGGDPQASTQPFLAGVGGIGGFNDPFSGKEYPLATFRVPSIGYPIYVGVGQTGSPPGTTIRDRPGIAKHLTDMATHRGSPLVLYLAFLRRRQLQKQP